MLALLLGHRIGRARGFASSRNCTGLGGRGERRKKSSFPCSQMEWAAGHPAANILRTSQEKNMEEALPALPEDTWDLLGEVPQAGWCLGNKIPSSVSLPHHISCFPDFLPSLARVPFFQNQLHEFFLSDLSVFYSKHRKPFTGIVFSNIEPKSSNKTINVFKKIGSDFFPFFYSLVILTNF